MDRLEDVELWYNQLPTDVKLRWKHSHRLWCLRLLSHHLAKSSFGSHSYGRGCSVSGSGTLASGGVVAAAGYNLFRSFCHRLCHPIIWDWVAILGMKRDGRLEKCR